MKKLCEWIKKNHPLPSSGEVDWKVYSLDKTMTNEPFISSLEYGTQITGSCAAGTELLVFDLGSTEQVFKERADHSRILEDKIERGLRITLSLDARALLGASQYGLNQKRSTFPTNGNNSTYTRKDSLTGGLKSVLLSVNSDQAMSLQFSAQAADSAEDAREAFNDGTNRVDVGNTLRKASYTSTLTISLASSPPVSYGASPVNPEGLPFALTKKLVFFRFDPNY